MCEILSCLRESRVYAKSLLYPGTQHILGICGPCHPFEREKKNTLTLLKINKFVFVANALQAFTPAFPKKLDLKFFSKSLSPCLINNQGSLWQQALTTPPPQGQAPGGADRLIHLNTKTHVGAHCTHTQASCTRAFDCLHHICMTHQQNFSPLGIHIRIIPGRVFFKCCG
jgi:hypothetical protein